MRLRFLLSIAGLALFLCIWEAAVRSGLLPRTLVPAPSAVPQAFVNELRNGFWVSSVLASLNHYALGLAFGSVGGVAFGLATALSPRLDALTAGLTRLLRPIPPLAWIPFALIWFGATEGAAAFIIAIGVFWVNYFATFAAVRGDRSGPGRGCGCVRTERAYGTPGQVRSSGRVARNTRRITDGIGAGLDGGRGSGIIRRPRRGAADERCGRAARDRRAGRLHAHHRFPLRGQRLRCSRASAGGCSHGRPDPRTEGRRVRLRRGRAVGAAGSVAQHRARPVRGRRRAVGRGQVDAAAGDRRAGAAAGGIGGGCCRRPKPAAARPRWCFRMRGCCRGGACCAMPSWGWRGSASPRRRVDRGRRRRWRWSGSRRRPASGRTSSPAGSASGSASPRALAVRPGLLLVDEPFGALDAITRDTLQDELLRLWQETGATIIFVTHDLNEAVLSGRPRHHPGRLAGDGNARHRGRSAAAAAARRVGEPGRSAPRRDQRGVHRWQRDLNRWDL